MGIDDQIKRDLDEILDCYAGSSETLNKWTAINIDDRQQVVVAVIGRFILSSAADTGHSSLSLDLSKPVHRAIFDVLTNSSLGSLLEFDASSGAVAFRADVQQEDREELCRRLPAIT